MEPATEHLRALARRVVAAALELGPLRAAMLAGSAARGDADSWSDLDLLLYVDELPPPERLEQLRAALGGASPIRFGDRTDFFDALQFEVDGVAVQASYATVARHEEHLERLLGGDEAVYGPSQKILVGVLEGLALHGDELVDRWRARVSEYPGALRRGMVERHWSFFPLWHFGDAMAARDAELWRLDMLLEASFNLLAVLAGLNRVYFARFELKRTRAFVAKLEVAPADLADRLESLFRLPPGKAADELGRLVLETRELVHGELPELELRVRFPPGTRRQPWR